MVPTGQAVLVVDDDQSVLYTIETMLRCKDYSPIIALGPLEALKKSREFKGDIHLLLTDVVMPVMDGYKLAQQILAERPLIRILMMSGYNAESSRLPLLKKPFRIEQLVAEVAKVIGGPPPLPNDVLVKPSEHGLRAALTTEVDEA